MESEYNHDEYIKNKNPTQRIMKDQTEPTYILYEDYPRRATSIKFTYEGRKYDGFTLNQAKKHWKFLRDHTEERTAIVGGRLALIYPNIKDSYGNCLFIEQPTSQWSISSFKKFSDIDVQEALHNTVSVDKVKRNFIIAHQKADKKKHLTTV